MANLVKWLLHEAGEESIEAVIIGEFGCGNEDDPIWAEDRNVVLTWEQAKPLLDYTFREGYGAPSCHAVFAYTPTYVIAIAQYDGSTAPFKIPRQPTACNPFMPGE